MDASHRGALMLVRFIAACLMGLGVVEITLSWAESFFQQKPVNVPGVVLWAVLFMAGVALLFKAKSVAEWMADKLE